MNPIGPLKLAFELYLIACCLFAPVDKKTFEIELREGKSDKVTMNLYVERTDAGFSIYGDKDKKAAFFSVKKDGERYVLVQESGGKKTEYAIDNSKAQIKPLEKDGKFIKEIEGAKVAFELKDGARKVYQEHNDKLFLVGCRPGPQSEPESAVSDTPDSKLREQLVRTLADYAEACMKGDVKRFKALRASAEVKRIESILAQRGAVLSAESITPKTPESIQRLLKYPVIQMLHRAEYARLAFLNNNAQDMGVRGLKKSEVEIVFVLFHHEDDTWKVLQLGPVVLAKEELDPENKVPEEKVPAVFRIPG